MHIHFSSNCVQRAKYLSTSIIWSIWVWWSINLKTQVHMGPVCGHASLWSLTQARTSLSLKWWLESWRMNLTHIQRSINTHHMSLGLSLFTACGICFQNKEAITKAVALRQHTNEEQAPHQVNNTFYCVKSSSMLVRPCFLTHVWLSRSSFFFMMADV